MVSVLAFFWYQILTILQADRCFKWSRLGGMHLERWREKCVTHLKIFPLFISEICCPVIFHWVVWLTVKRQPERLLCFAPLFFFFFLVFVCLIFLRWNLWSIYLFIFKRNLFFYFCLCCVFVAVCGLPPAAVSRGHSSLWCAAFSLRWLLLLQSTSSRRVGFSSCGMPAQ